MNTWTLGVMSMPLKTLVVDPSGFLAPITAYIQVFLLTLRRLLAEAVHSTIRGTIPIWEFRQIRSPNMEPEVVGILSLRTPQTRTPHVWKEPVPSVSWAPIGPAPNSTLAACTHGPVLTSASTSSPQDPATYSALRFSLLPRYIPMQNLLMMKTICSGPQVAESESAPHQDM